MTRHGEAVTCVVITCLCGQDFDGFSYSAASASFEDHLAAEDRYSTAYRERFATTPRTQHGPGRDRVAP